jgi:hypothetical protein
MTPNLKMMTFNADCREKSGTRTSPGKCSCDVFPSARFSGLGEIALWRLAEDHRACALTAIKAELHIPDLPRDLGAIGQGEDAPSSEALFLISEARWLGQRSNWRRYQSRTRFAPVASAWPG